MIKIRIGFIISVTIINFFSSISSYDTYECIGLGETCTVSAALQAFNLRKAAYPFDWTISPYESLCQVLENNFENFLNPQYLSIRDDNHGIINKYGIVFVHDFPTIQYTGNVETEDTVGEGELHPHWIDSLSEVEKKYARRIQRLRDTCMSDKKIYFIRHTKITREQACILRDIIKTAYPELDFILVIVGDDPELATQWQEPHIRNYYLHTPTVWNDVAEWKKIFIDLNLI